MNYELITHMTRAIIDLGYEPIARIILPCLHPNQGAFMWTMENATEMASWTKFLAGQIDTAGLIQLLGAVTDRMTPEVARALTSCFAGVTGLGV